MLTLWTVGSILGWDSWEPMFRDLASAPSQFESMWSIDGTDCMLPKTGYCCVMSVFCHSRPGWLPYLDVAIRGGDD
jgi:hypothetical protein